jgi:hypothetical protein
MLGHGLVAGLQAGMLPASWGNEVAGPSMNLLEFRCADCGLSGSLPAWGANNCADATLEKARRPRASCASPSGVHVPV